eukprot:m.74397 g.74397  ORF g.74397 m.74397 type:complete len:268 (-) comp12457_c0_seq1:1850-2653(-)
MRHSYSRQLITLGSVQLRQKTSIMADVPLALELLSNENVPTDFPNLKVLPSDANVRSLHTHLFDASTSVSEHMFYTLRLVQMVVELALNQLPTTQKKVITPEDVGYDGLSWGEPVCAVTMMQSGEPLERGLRETCKGMRVSHLLILRDDRNDAKVHFSNVSNIADIQKRWVLILDTIIHQNSVLLEAIRLLNTNGVALEKIVVVCLLASKEVISVVQAEFPQVSLLKVAYWIRTYRFLQVTIVTSGILQDTLAAKLDIAKKYFGIEQ